MLLSIIFEQVFLVGLDIFPFGIRKKEYFFQQVVLRMRCNILENGDGKGSSQI